MKLNRFFLRACSLACLPAPVVSATVPIVSSSSITPEAAANAALDCVYTLQKELNTSTHAGWTIVDSVKKNELFETLELATVGSLYKRDGLYLGYNPNWQQDDIKICEISSDIFQIPEFGTPEYRRMWVVFNKTFGLNFPQKWPESTWHFQNLLVSLILVTPDKNYAKMLNRPTPNSLIYISIAPAKAIK